MTRITRKPVAIAMAASLVAGALVSPSIAATTKTKKVRIEIASKIDGTKLGGKVTGGTFGKGTQTGTNAPPKITNIWKFKGGTITAKVADGHIVSAKIVGTFKFVKGTGKYKGIKGKGKAVGSVLGDFKFTGTAKY